MNEQGRLEAVSGEVDVKRQRLAALVESAQVGRRGAWTREFMLGWCRLVTFGLIAVGLFWGDWSFGLRSVVAMTGVLLFGVSVALHRVARARRKHFDHFLTVSEETGRRLGGRVELIRSCASPVDARPEAVLAPFYDDGTVWPLTPQEINDMDTFEPPVGLFGLLNRTSSLPGCRRLRDLLVCPALDVQVIRARQARIRVLGEDVEARLGLMASMVFSRPWDREFDALVSATGSTDRSLPSARVLTLRVWSVISLVLFLWFFVLAGGGDLLWAYPLLLLLLVNGAIYASLRRRLDGLLRRWRNVSGVIAALGATVDGGVSHLPRAPELEGLSEAFEVAHRERLFPRLFRLAGWTESGGPFHALFNVLCFFDLHVTDALERRVVRYREGYLRAMSAAAELDALCSLAAFSWEQPVMAWPEVVDDKRLHMAGGVHPLIDPSHAVDNDVLLDASRRIWIVTGSNMAGKSTLLRTVGANVLLAQSGTTVCAGSMSLCPVRMISDLDAHDSLADGESYFLAEVRHLRRLVKPPPGDAPLLGLVDEPLRGTNSREQTAAGVAVVDYLRREGHFFLIATHEQELTKLADGESVANVHFRERLDETGMVFDYKVYEGPARTRNALGVLAREGYPESLLTRAYGWLDEHERRYGS